MKQKLLLTLFITSINFAVSAQKASVYAITGSQKGQSNWSEVRLIDIASGEELKTVYKNSEETQILNARTGKPVAKKEIKNDFIQLSRMAPDGQSSATNDNLSQIHTIMKVKPRVDNNSTGDNTLRAVKVREAGAERMIENNGHVKIKALAHHSPHATSLEAIKAIESKLQSCKTNVVVRTKPSLDKPFSTYSAACAYDKKHERLYYTPMGIAQLRYIDLKSKTPQVFYFENEQFGALRSRGDVANQITRMVIGADGHGYALSNNADHLIQFTTNKKAVITDLGALIDDPSNGKFSVRSTRGYGGDIIAAKTGDLYLITANRNVFQINIKSLVATYKGTIQGLPAGYSTNGAAVEEGSVVIINSSNSTEGYYRFDMNTLVAEKVGNNGPVHNASDLATANLLAVKKENETTQVITPETQIQALKVNSIQTEGIQQTKLGVYPNPVTNGIVNLLLDNYAPGRYQAKLIEATGKQLTAKSFAIGSKNHSEPFTLPATISKGTYLIQIYNQASQSAGIVKLVVQ